MNIPKIPTDNIYKFLALSGLLIIIITIFFYVLLFNEIKEKTLQIEGEVTLSKIRLDYLEKKINRTKKKLSEKEILLSVENLSDALDGKNNKLENDIERLDETDKMYNFINPLSNIHLTAINNKTKILLIEYKKKFLSIITIFGSIFILVGFFLTIIGFYFWYNRVQIFLDKKNKIELNILELELKRIKGENKKILNIKKNKQGLKKK